MNQTMKGINDLNWLKTWDYKSVTLAKNRF